MSRIPVVIPEVLDETRHSQSDISIHGSVPTEIRMEVIKNKIHMKEERYKNTYRSCCFGNTDKRLCEYATQASIGCAVLFFCGYNLTFNSNCESDPAYWSLLSSTVSYFLTRKAMGARDSSK